jgi:predicted DNA-binding transcriptional regulator AlpA
MSVESFLKRGQLIRLPKVLEALGIRRSKFYQGVQSGEFPAPRKLGRTSVWKSDDIIDLIQGV